MHDLTNDLHATIVTEYILFTSKTMVRQMVNKTLNKNKKLEASQAFKKGQSKHHTGMQ